MANRFIRQVLVQDESIAVSAQRIDDLPVNPLSVVLMTVRAQTSAADEVATMSNLLATLANVEILFQGSAVVAASLADLAALYLNLSGNGVWPLRTSQVAAAARIGLTVPILLGRKPYWVKECFPAVKRGELQLRTTAAAAFTNLDTVSLQIETIELLEARPERFIKYTTISKTPSATGDHDLDLPIGNMIVGTLLFGTTVPVDGSFNASIGQLRLLLDNVEYDYAKANWESLFGDASLRADYPYAMAEHIHNENSGAAYVQNANTEAGETPTSFMRNYAYLDFDPHKDDSFLIDTKGLARIFLRITADAADAIRVIPVELLTVAGGAPM